MTMVILTSTFNRIILNGLATYTTWTIVLSLINLATALVYVGQVGQRDASLLGLSLLLIGHCLWFGLENFLVDRYARYQGMDWR